jgi:hypothetical protein
MGRLGFKLTAAESVRALLIGGYLLMLAANMPGHLSPDSIAQLYEGRLGVRETWGPAVYAAMLGFFDNIIRGTGLYVVASGLLLFSSLLRLLKLRPGTSWLGAVAAAALVISPTLLIYQGIVWKDVLFANLAVAGFILLASVAQGWTPRGARPWLALIVIVLMFALGAQVRQNGIIAAAFAAAALAWIARIGGWKSSLTWGVGGLIAVVAASMLLGAAAQPRGAGPDAATSRGVRILEQYDIIGAAAHDPGLSLEIIRKANPESERILRTRAVPLYSPERVDYLGLDPVVGPAIWRLPTEVVQAQWTSLVLDDTPAYLAHRWDVFRWVFLTPMIDSCLPVYVGVDGPDDKLKTLSLERDVDQTDQTLFNYSTWLMDTPVFSHLSYAIVAALVALALLLRRERTDLVVAGLMLSALAFTASFFVISIACDYRYLYFLDLSALTGLLYLAIDPPMPRWGRSR